MSDMQPSPPSRGSGCLSVLAIGVGVVLLLPGACAIVLFTIQGARELASLLLLVGIVGCALIALGASHEYWRNKARDQIKPPAGLTAGPRTVAVVVGVMLVVGTVLWAAAWALWNALLHTRF